MDLSELGLSEDQLLGVEKHVEGLKAKNTDLMDEAKKAKLSVSEKEAIAEEARKAAASAKAEALESLGKYEEAQKLREDERAELVAQANAERDNAKLALDKYHLSSAKNSVLNKVLDQFQPAAEAVLNNAISVSYDDNGNANTVFKHGEQEFSSAADFINGVGEDAMWSGMLKGADSSGAGTKQVNNSGGASSSGTDKTQSALEQRLKRKGLQP